MVAPVQQVALLSLQAKRNRKNQESDVKALTLAQELKYAC